MTQAIDHWRALALQTRCDAINGLSLDEARASMRATIERVGRQIRAAKGFIGSDTRLVVLPEYFLTSFPLGEGLAGWRTLAAIEQDGVEYELLGEIAQANAVYIAGNAYECDPAFPTLYFQTSFVLNDSGDVVLRYRRLQSLFAPGPYYVWSHYLDVYGADAIFPVADTPLGRLAAIASEEILYPEIARALALRGAEVFVHSTSEVGSPALTPKDIAKRARAFENNAYLVSANSAGIANHDIPESSTDGMSKVVDWQGVVIAEAGFGESMVANAELDMAGLRRWRRRPGMQNMLARQRPGMFAEVYADNDGMDALLHDGEVVVPDRSYFVDSQQARIRKLIDDGII